MKTKQTEPKYATYGQLVDELAKFDQKDPAGVAKAFGVSEEEMVREAERLGLAGEKAETACA